MEIVNYKPKSNAEKKVYGHFKANLPDDWKGIANLKLIGVSEIDLLLIIPKKGIVVVEIKGGEIILENDTMFSRDKERNVHKIEPYVQLNKEIKELKNHIDRLLPIEEKEELMNCINIEGIVIFPDCDINIPQNIKNKILTLTKSQFFSGNLKETIIKVFENHSYNKGNSIGFNNKLVDFIFSSLYENERAKNEIPKTLKLIQKDIYTSVIDSIEKNSIEVFNETLKHKEIKPDKNIILIEGPAGSGKTFLGKSFAEFYARSGKRVLFCCFNLLLGESLKDEMAKIYPKNNLIVDSFYNLVRRYIEKSSKKNDFLIEKAKPHKDNLWYLDYFNDIEIKEKDKFDIIIVDEFQDLGNEIFYKAFEKLSYHYSQLILLFDNRQTIQNKSKIGENLVYKFKKYKKCISFQLTDNIRNTLKIGKFAEKICGFSYEKILSKNAGKIEYYKYTNSDALKAKLFEYIGKLVDKEEIESESITILTAKSLNKEAKYKSIFVDKVIDKANNPESPKLYLSVPLVTGREVEIQIDTIRRFKGLENKVIILIEFDNSKDLPKLSEEEIDLFYCGITRSKLKLAIFMHKDFPLNLDSDYVVKMK